MATCNECGCTISWDCECNPEYNEMLEEGNRQADLKQLEYELSTLSHGEDGIDNTALRANLQSRINRLRRML